MRLLLTITILVIVASALTLGQARSTSKAKGVEAMSSNEQEILNLEEEYRQAAIRLDVAALDRIFADDLMSIAPIGVVVGKAHVLDEARRAAGHATIETYNKEDMKVRVYGDTAVSSFQLVIKSKFNSTEINRQYRVTNVWLKRQGRWQIIACHTAQLEKS